MSKLPSMYYLTCAALFFATGCLLAGTEAFAAESNVVKNPSFEEGEAAVPDSWVFENKASGKGSSGYSRDHVHSGQRSLQLTPNSNNNDSGIANAPLGVGQTSGENALLSSSQLGCSDEFHGSGNLLDILHRSNSTSNVTKIPSGHELSELPVFFLIKREVRPLFLPQSES